MLGIERVLPKSGRHCSQGWVGALGLSIHGSDSRRSAHSWVRPQGITTQSLKCPQQVRLIFYVHEPWNIIFLEGVEAQNPYFYSVSWPRNDPKNADHPRGVPAKRVLPAEPVKKFRTFSVSRPRFSRNEWFSVKMDIHGRSRNTIKIGVSGPSKNNTKISAPETWENVVFFEVFGFRCFVYNRGVLGLAEHDLA